MSTPLGSRPRPSGLRKPVASDIDVLAVGRDPQEALLARGRVEVAGGIALEAADEVVTGGRGVVGVADAFVEVGLAVAVQIVQPGDLVAAENVDQTVDDHQARAPGAGPRRIAASARGSSVASSPSTCQTSPCIVQSMAEPSGRKSWSPKNSRAFHGFSNGGSIVSIA